MPTPVPERDQWLAIEMRHLAALAAVAEEASFSGAADNLGYVQSAISQQIAYLERIVGRRLVERSGRPRSVTLTDAGSVLLHHVDEILGQLRLAKRDIDAISRPDDMPVRLGMATIFGAWVPAALLERMLPDMTAHNWGRLERGSSETLLDAVAAGRLEAAFVDLPIASGPFFAIELVREPCVLVAPAAKAHRMDVETVLDHWPIVDVDDCRATKALRARAGSARSHHSVDSPARALPFVRSRAAAAVMTRRDLRACAEGLDVLPLQDVPDRALGLAWLRDRDGSPAICSLRAAARAAFPRAPGDVRAA